MILPKSQFQRNRVVLDIDCIVGCELEALESRIVIFDGMGPRIPVGGDEIAAMSNICVVKVILGGFYAVFKADSNAHPPYEFLYLDTPL